MPQHNKDWCERMPMCFLKSRPNVSRPAPARCPDQRNLDVLVSLSVRNTREQWDPEAADNCSAQCLIKGCEPFHTMSERPCDARQSKPHTGQTSSCQAYLLLLFQLAQPAGYMDDKAGPTAHHAPDHVPAEPGRQSVSDPARSNGAYNQTNPLGKTTDLNSAGFVNDSICPESRVSRMRIGARTVFDVVSEGCAKVFDWSLWW